MQEPTQEPTQEKSKDYPKAKIALPTIGRNVYYYDTTLSSKPHAAFVTNADEGSYTVNLYVLGHQGGSESLKGVPHVATIARGETKFWDWMDYQKGQAAKTEQLQQELDKKAFNQRAEDKKTLETAKATRVHGQSGHGY